LAAFFVLLFLAIEFLNLKLVDEIGYVDIIIVRYSAEKRGRNRRKKSIRDMTVSIYRSSTLNVMRTAF